MAELKNKSTYRPRTRPGMFKWIGLTILTVSILAVSTLTALSCIGNESLSPPSGNSPNATVDDRFIRLFQEGKYKEAHDLVEKELKEYPDDGVLLSYGAACHAMLEEFEPAVEEFLLSNINSTEGYSDKSAMYLQALSLYKVKANSRAQQTIDQLSSKFPHSRVAKMGQELALEIEKRLAKGVTAANLNWYIDKGVKCHEAEKPALAIEYLREYFLLKKRTKDAGDALDYPALFALGGSYIEVGLPDTAIGYLKKLPLEYGMYRAGIMLAIGYKANEEHEKAIVTLKSIAARTTSEAVKARANLYLKEWAPGKDK